MVLVYVPTIECEYSVFIPVGRTVGAVKKIIVDILCELTGQEFSDSMQLVDGNTSKSYLDGDLVINTEIKNGTKLLLI